MSESIRLHHPHFASCNYVVELPKALMAGSKVCPTCSQPNKPVAHAQKALHLRLDANGDCFVSPQMWAAHSFQLGLAGLTAEGKVTNAPGLLVGAVELPQQETITPNGDRHWVPERTKYESEKTVQAPFIPLLTKIAEDYDKERTAKLAEKRSVFILGRRRDG